MVYKSLGFGAKMESLITRAMLDIMGVLYVGDTDLFILNDFASSELNVHEESQSALTAWGMLLISTNGALKPEKYFYYMVDDKWDNEGF